MHDKVFWAITVVHGRVYLRTKMLKMLVSN